MAAPLIIAHRGASAVAPENTIAAFEAAIQAGADGVEFDVRLTRDGVPVVIHDETLYRTHGVRGRVADLTLNELNTMDVGGKERVPSLEQLFELFASNKMFLCLEMKGQQSELAAACCRLIDEHRLKDRVVLSCFDHSQLETVKQIASTFRTAALFQPPASSIVERTLSVGASEIALHHRLVNKDIVEKARAADLKVVTWTVDDPAWVERARVLDIHAVITNDPSALIRARNAI